MKSNYYINVNGAFGMGAYTKPEFPELKDLLAEMDRLGVWQTVAFHNLARDLHPSFGNRWLLEAIDQTPGAAERVIPAFAVNPSMLAGEGEMEAVEAALKSGKVGCLQLFPKTNRYTIVEIGRVLERLRAYRPCVLIDVTELNPVINQPDRAPSMDLEMLVDIANRFPEMSFVLRKVMWWQFSHVIDVLARTKNVFLDISMLHTRDAIGIVERQCGKGRMVFGIGAKAHSGAAISSLAYSHIDQKGRDAIAFDTFANLLPELVRGRVVAARKSVPNRISNRFWNDFIDGKGVTNALVIDAHTHIGPFTRSWIIPNNEFDGQIREFEEDMKRFGVDMVCSQSEAELFGAPIVGNKMLEDAIGDRTDRFRGNFVINPIYAELYTDKVLDEFFSRPYFCGMKLIPEYIGVDVADPRLERIFAYANKYRLHILFHSWEGKFGTARQIAEVATKYPDATFIIGHTGGGTEGRHQCEAIAEDPKYANCCFEFCGTFTTDVPWSETLKHIDYRRVLYGTDTVVHEIAWELGRLLSMDLPDEWLEAILGKNMQRVLARRIPFGA